MLLAQVDQSLQIDHSEDIRFINLAMAMARSCQMQIVPEVSSISIENGIPMFNIAITLQLPILQLIGVLAEFQKACEEAQLKSVRTANAHTASSSSVVRTANADTATSSSAVRTATADTATDVVSGVEASEAQHEAQQDWVTVEPEKQLNCTWETAISELQSTHVVYAMATRWEPMGFNVTCDEASLTAIRPMFLKTPALKWTQPNNQSTEPTGKQNNSQLTRAVHPSGPSTSAGMSAGMEPRKPL